MQPDNKSKDSINDNKIDNQQNQNKNNDNNYSQNLNKSIKSDTIQILNLLNTYPSHQIEEKQNNQNNNNDPQIDQNIDNYSYDEIKTICLKIFMHYAYPINTIFYISKTNLFKLLKDVKIISEKYLSNVDIEILFQQVNKACDKLDSNQFLDLLAKICCLLDETFYENKKQSFIKMIKKFIEPYLNNLENNNEKINNEESKIDLSSTNNKKKKLNLNMNLNFKEFILKIYQFDSDTYSILMSIIECLRAIYVSYFNWSELALNKTLKRIEPESYSIYMKLLKDFELMPNPFKQRLAELYWPIIISTKFDMLINNKNLNIDKLLKNKRYNIGKLYTFHKFILLFSHIACYYYYPIESKTNAEKLLYFIEKIYKSNGYTNLPNIFSKTFNRKYTIIPPINIVKKVNKNLLEKPNYIEANIQRRHEHKDFSNFDGNLQNFLGINEENYEILKKYLEKLRNIFDIYCQISDKYQFGKMTFSNYQKMLADGKILCLNKKIAYKHPLTRNASCSFGSDKYFEIYKGVNSYNNSRTTSKKNFTKCNSQQEIIPKKNSNNNINSPTGKLNTSDYNISLNDTLNNNHKTKNTYNNNLNNTDKNIKQNQLSIADLNIIFAEVCGIANQTLYNNNNKFLISNSQSSISIGRSNIFDTSYNRENTLYKLDFFLFLRTLPMIALKLYPNENNDIDISTNMFLKNNFEIFLAYITPIALSYSQNYEVSNLLKSVSSDETLIQLMKDIENLIHAYYIFYCDDKEKCNFSSFVSFFRDYGIYPYWISYVNILEIFNGEVYKINQNIENNIETKIKKEEKIDFQGFLECFISIGLCMNSGNDLDCVDKVLFMIDKIFSDTYGKTVKKIRNVPSYKYDYLYHEKILRKKYPSYYERKYSNCAHRYDNKFFWIYEKNNENNQIMKVDYGNLFEKEKVKFDDVFDGSNFSDINKQYDKNVEKNSDVINEEVKEEMKA